MCPLPVHRLLGETVTAAIAKLALMFVHSGMLSLAHPPVRSLSAGAPSIVNVPSMGDSITEGTIVQWVKGK